MFDEPISIFPKPLVIEPAFNAPTVVNDDVTTLDAKVVPVNSEAAAVPLPPYSIHN